MFKFQTTSLNCFASIVIFLTKSLKYPIFNEFLLVSCQPCISSEKRNFLFPCHHFSACHTDWEKFYTVWCQSVLGLRKKHCMQKVLHILVDILERTKSIEINIAHNFLAPTGALIVFMFYYSIRSAAATFWNFKHFCQLI